MVASLRVIRDSNSMILGGERETTQPLLSNSVLAVYAANNSENSRSSCSTQASMR